MNKYTLTIPQKLAEEGELVIIPRRKYEEILNLVRKKTFKKIDKGILESLFESEQGKNIGPFNSVGALIKSLGTR